MAHAAAAQVSGRLAARRQAKENYNAFGKEKKGGAFFRQLRLRSEDLDIPTRVHLLRPKEPYPDPSKPELHFWWKTGMSYFIKTKKFKRGIPIEKNFSEDLIDAYANPKQYKLENTEGIADGKWLAKYQARPYYCVCGLIEEWFHSVQFVDESRKDDNGKPVSWSARVRCTGKNCENCREKWPRVFGNRFWFDFSFAQWFGPIDAVFEKLDRLPKDGGYVYPLHYECEECHNILRFIDSKSREEVKLDMMNACSSCQSEDIGIDADEHVAECNDCNTRWSLLSHEDPKLTYYLSSILECLDCGHKGYPNPVMAHSEGKEEWETYDIFDLQLTLHMVQDGKSRRLEVKKFAVQEPDSRLFDPALQGEGEVDKTVERHKEPLDLEKVHQVMSADEQAELLELSNLFDPNREARAQRKKVRWRGRNEEENPETEDQRQRQEGRRRAAEDDDASDDEADDE